MMGDREVIVKAGGILAEHGTLAADFIIKQLGDVIEDCAAVKDWCRVAPAVDVIAAASPQ